ncbi:hypothetical protein [Namhaeicola litoreus]|uniref:Uncharacterized protein n=1 Tax=Namhaeicola litoreus TaxID=1052145 RepID=A0ABW3XZX7_9FLAO
MESILSFAKDEAKYIYVSPIEKFKKFESFFQFLKVNENKDFEPHLELKMKMHEHSIKCFERHVEKNNLKRSFLLKKLKKEITNVRQYLSYERRLLLIRFYRNNRNEHNMMLWLEHPFIDFTIKKIGDTPLVAYLAEKLTKKECDLIKIEICK